MRQWWRKSSVYLGVAILAMSIGALTRALAADSQDLARLTEFESATGLDVGPDAAWFTTGLSGDGAVFTIMAADPLGRDQGKFIREASYRYARVGFSWVSALLVLGRESLLLLGLSAVGLISVGVVAGMALALSRRVGIRGWLLLVSPALFIGFLYDTAEPLAIALTATIFFTAGYIPTAALAIVRPTFAISTATSWRHLTLAGVIAVAFRLYWVTHFGDALFGVDPIGLPLVGIFHTFSLAGGLVVLSGVVTVVIGIWRRNLAWILCGVLVCCFGDKVLADPINAVRAAGMLPVLWAFGPGFHLGRGESQSAAVTAGG
jgi:hypothetical protein